MKMNNREKVIYGLSCWGEDADYDVHGCEGCPYNISFGDEEPKGCDVKQIARDALDMAREQHKEIKQLSAARIIQIHNLRKGL